MKPTGGLSGSLALSLDVRLARLELRHERDGKVEVGRQAELCGFPLVVLLLVLHTHTRVFRSIGHDTHATTLQDRRGGRREVAARRGSGRRGAGRREGG